LIDCVEKLFGCAEEVADSVILDGAIVAMTLTPAMSWRKEVSEDALADNRSKRN